MRRYLRDPTFSRFDTIPECDGHTHTHTQTDRQTDRHTTTAYTALSKASRGKKTTKLMLGFRQLTTQFDRRVSFPGLILTILFLCALFRDLKGK